MATTGAPIHARIQPLTSGSWGDSSALTVSSSTGSRCDLGGGLGLDSGMGRTLRGHKVTSADLRECIARVVTDFVNARRPGERFPAWLARAGEGELI
jgi:sulfite reductase beta subunit-like hemoprotein